VEEEEGQDRGVADSPVALASRKASGYKED